MWNTSINVVGCRGSELQQPFNSTPTFATAQRTAMDLSVSRERAFL